jgi:hypothetical protein
MTQLSDGLAGKSSSQLSAPLEKVPCVSLGLVHSSSTAQCLSQPHLPASRLPQFATVRTPSTRTAAAACARRIAWRNVQRPPLCFVDQCCHSDSCAKEQLACQSPFSTVVGSLRIAAGRDLRFGGSSVSPAGYPEYPEYP